MSNYRTIKFKKCEQEVYLNRIKSPLFALRSILFMLRRYSHRMLYRLLPTHILYPPAIRQAWSIAGLHKNYPLGAEKIMKNTVPTKGGLLLATGKWEFPGGNQWFLKYDDEEDLAVLSRWNWLLTGWTSNPKEMNETQGWALVRSWVAFHGALPDGVANDPYTVGERIANACLFAYIQTGKPRPPEDLHPVLCKMAFSLADRMEFWGEENTGNHAFNNARGLFFAGQCLEIPALSDLAIVVFRHMLPKLVSSEGFLLEGSSHYQFLFTRWVLELWWLAEWSRNRPASQLLQPVAEAMVQCCDFLVVRRGEERRMPLIGDVSPDFPPEWLIGVPDSPLVVGTTAEQERNEGWSTLWNDAQLTLGSLSNASVPSVNPFRCFEESYWYRLDWNGWTVFWHAPSSDQPGRSGHFHEDFGSFVLYFRGVPVLVDRGRYSYQLGDLVAEQQMSPQGHNTLTIEGVGASIGPLHRRYPRFYRASSISLRSSMEGERYTITLFSDGFKRLGTGVTGWSRHFHFTPHELVIQDELTGVGEHQLGTYFQWDPALNLNRSGCGWRWSGAGLRGLFDRGNANQEVFEKNVRGSVGEGQGWFSPAYGQKLPSYTLEFSEKVSLPYRAEYRLAVEP